MPAEDERPEGHPGDDPPDDGEFRGERRRARPHDGEDDYDDVPSRRRPEPAIEATDFLIPTGVSGYSIAACYFGLVSCFLPLIGVVLALIALVCGIVALRRRKKTGTYGSVTSDVRAVIGIVLSTLTLLFHLGFVALAIIKANTR
jgi:hypothetical protein